MEQLPKNSLYIYPDELLKRWNINSIDFLDYFNAIPKEFIYQRSGIDHEGIKSLPKEERVLKIYYFHKSGILEAEKLLPWLKPEPHAGDLIFDESQSQANQIKDSDILIIDEETSWGNVIINIIGEEEMLIQVGENSYTRRIEQAGFRDNRKSSGNNSWGLLKIFAKKKEIPYIIGDTQKVQKDIQVLREKLKALFPCVVGDPIITKREEKCYQSKFILRSNFENSTE